MDDKFTTPDREDPGHAMPYAGNLYMLIDVYKHSWDLFFRGTALYLAACTAIGAILVYGDPDLFQKLFVGAALCFGSLLAIRGFIISKEYFYIITKAIDEKCQEYGYIGIPFKSALKFLTLMISVGWILFVVGLFYITHVLFLEEGWQELAIWFTA